MVFLLPGNVALHALQRAQPNRERTISRLPGEAAQLREGLVDPPGGIRFHDPHHVRERVLLIQPGKKMHMVRHAADGDQLALFGPNQSTEVGEQTILEFGSDCGLTVFGTEDDVIVQRGPCLWHCDPQPVATSGLGNGASLPGACAPGKHRSPLRGLKTISNLPLTSCRPGEGEFTAFTSPRGSTASLCPCPPARSPDPRPASR